MTALSDSVSSKRIAVIGGGLAGCEAALQLAKYGLSVTLYDQKPHHRSPAHHNPNLAEIVCSNSFGSQGPTTASGLLKLEMMALDCELLKIAQSIAVPAGKALAVDREQFAETVTQAIYAHPHIHFVGEAMAEIPADAQYVIVATGPLTSPELAQTLSRLVDQAQLFFFDAASPILTKESIDFQQAFVQDRYGLPATSDLNSESDVASSGAYINCPLDQIQYEALIDFILAAEKTPLKDFEQAGKASFFESCLPIEVMAARGRETLRFGPMKPVGLVDPRTQKRPHAVVQLRQDNQSGTLYNMVGFQTNLKWGPQQEMIRMIPGLEQAEVVRYGVMHRNTYLHSPTVLQPTLQLKKHPHILVAGQLTGTEGYTESIATGMLAALNVRRMICGEQGWVLPPETMLGSLLRYITREEAIGQAFQPINSNWGVLPSLTQRIRDKKIRVKAYADRSLGALATFLATEKHPVSQESLAALSQ